MTSKTATEDTRPSLLEKARSAMPGLTTVETGLADVTTRLRQARASVRPEESVVDVALETVLDGEKVPDDVGPQVLKIRRSNEAAFAAAQVLGPMERRLQERLLVVHREQADDALAVLRAELDTVISQAGPVLAELGDVDSADAAIAADRVVQWRQADAMASRYVGVRDAQRVIVAAALDPPDQPRATSRVSPQIRDLLADYGFVREADRHHPTVGTGANGGEVRLSGSRIFSGRLVTDAHTDAPVTPRPWLTGDTITDLRFACRAGVEPWVPAINELTGARDEHEQRKQDEARDEAERMPGDEPERRLPHGRRMPPPPAALLDRIAREELGESV